MTAIQAAKREANLRKKTALEKIEDAIDALLDWCVQKAT